MNDIEAFLLLLSNLLPFGGLMNIFWGIDISDSSKIIFGIVCLFIAIFIIGYLIYSTKKDKRLLKYGAKKIRLLFGVFRQVIASCILMIIEFIILWNFGFEIRQTMLIICLTLTITTIITHLFQKL